MLQDSQLLLASVDASGNRMPAEIQGLQEKQWISAASRRYTGSEFHMEIA